MLLDFMMSAVPDTTPSSLVRKTWEVMGNVSLLRFSRSPGLCLSVRLLSDSLPPLPSLFAPSRSYSNRRTPSWSTGVPTPGWGGQIILLCDSNGVQWQIITMVLLTNFLDAFPKSQFHLPMSQRGSLSFPEPPDLWMGPSNQDCMQYWLPITRRCSMLVVGHPPWVPQRTHQTKNSQGLSVCVLLKDLGVKKSLYSINPILSLSVSIPIKRISWHFRWENNLWDRS